MLNHASGYSSGHNTTPVLVITLSLSDETNIDMAPCPYEYTLGLGLELASMAADPMISGRPGISKRLERKSRTLIMCTTRCFGTKGRGIGSGAAAYTSLDPHHAPVPCSSRSIPML